MTKPHKIAWCTKTWNPIIGCSHASPGCDHCYAERMAKRQVAMGARGYAEVVENGRWNGKTALVKSELDKPLRWRNPQRIFVCSMGDLFHESVPDEWIRAVLCVVRNTPHHTFLILTKRAKRMRKFFNEYSLPGNAQWPRQNLHLGVTCESNDYRWRIEELVYTQAAKRIVSYEPAIGPLDIEKYLVSCDDCYGECSMCIKGVERKRFPAIDGVICGGESGPGSRPMNPYYARSLRDLCKNYGVPFMFKQWGEWVPSVDNSCFGQRLGDTGYFKDGYFFNRAGSIDHDDNVGCTYMHRVGKHRAGRLLDGRVHDEVA